MSIRSEVPDIRILAMVICWIAFFSGSSMAQENIYDTAFIPDAMKKDARSVIRLSKMDIDIRDNDKVIFREHQVVTYWSDKDFSQRYVVKYTDQFSALDQMDIRMYDARGKLQSRYSRKDMINQVTGDDLVENYTVYYLQLTPLSFPVTVETESVVRKKGYYQLPPFMICAPYQSVMQSSFTIRHPASMKISAKPYGIDIKPTVKNEDKDISSTWTVQSMPVHKTEPYAESWRTTFPQVRFVTSRMNFDGYEGNLSTWKDIGLWVNGLVKERGRLTPDQEKQVQALVQGVGDDREKVRILYQYLQRNFRYVSIQLGIGGYRPFPASFTHDKKYGDCKGLSFYMQSCLQAVGVKSYCALIAAGEDHLPVDPAFSFIPFNHEILCVPMAQNDTIWLECTNNLTDFGHLGSFTENRYALLIKEDGGVLVRTPQTRAAANQTSVLTRVTLQEDGSGEVASQIRTTGDAKFRQVNVSLQKADEQKQYFVRRLGFTDANSWNLQFGTREEVPFPTKLDLEMEKVPEFMAGSKMFLRPRLYRLFHIDYSFPEQRTKEFVLPDPFLQIDTTAYLLPEGFGPESLPDPVSIKASFGQFDVRYWFDAAQRTLFTTAMLRIDQAKVPVDQYAQLRQFMQQVQNEDRKKLIVKQL
jgi:hypothetical protein